MMQEKTHGSDLTRQAGTTANERASRPIWRLSDLDDVEIGDRVTLLGSYELTWDQDCLKPADLEPWRFEGDPLCDAVVRALNLRAGMDGLERMQLHMQLPKDEQQACVREFWEEVSRLPPSDISAVPSSPGSSSKSLPTTNPSSSDHLFTPAPTISPHGHQSPPTLAHGQAVFWRHASQIFACLLHFSLAGGFAAERIMGVLHETGYLVGGPAAAQRLPGAKVVGGGGCPVVGVAEVGKGGLSCPVAPTGRASPQNRRRHESELSQEELAARDKKERDRTYHRLLETTQAVIDYMSDMTPITGTGWQSAIRVRMLHSAVRVRLADKRGVRNVYDAALDGIPINQEDTIMTLGSFAVSPIYAMRRMGFYLTKAEEEAYVAAWRHIGYYLGVSPAKLRRHFSSEHRAERLSACTTMHLFSYDATSPFKANGEPETVAPPDPTSTATYKLLLSTCHRPPFYRTMDESLCLARVLLGEGMADRLALPPPSRMRRVRTLLTFRAQRFVHVFGGWYKYRVWDVLNPLFWLSRAMAAWQGEGESGAMRFRPYSWESERVDSTRKLIELVIFWQLGRKKAPFTVNEHYLVGEEPLGSVDETAAGEKRGDQAASEEDGDKAAYAMDQAHAKRTVRHFRGLLVEMGAVVVGLAGIGCVAGYAVWRTGVAYLS